MELRQFGIRVIVVQPGAIQTEWSGIAQQHLLHTSGQTAYGPLVRKHVDFLAAANRQGTHPRGVARTIQRAALSTRPRTRYATGGGAKAILWLRRLLSDKQFDSLMLYLIRRQKPTPATQAA
jgi:NAD(P)-dependent dehydrogenase (short-subunit alcohol dehydrogenase family)